MIETDPYAAWNAYATNAGLLDENGKARNRMQAQTAFNAFSYAWNLLVKQHILKLGVIER